MALQDAIRATTEPEYPHEPHPPGLFNGSDGTRLCYICGHTKRYVKQVERVEANHKAKSFFEEEVEAARQANRAPPRDSILVTHSKVALKLFDTMGKAKKAHVPEPGLLSVEELKALTAEKRHYLGSAASSVQQRGAAFR